MHPAALPDDPLLALCEVLRSRGSGPGGRHRNSTESRIVVRHVATGTEVTAGERRSQHENLAVALGRMRLALAVEVRTAVNAAPSDLWRSRTRGGRISCNPEHRDFPLLLAEALDVVACAEFDVRGAAERLGVSATQLIRFIAACHPALALVNRERGSRAMSQLRG
ncbi:MAG: peptide chain release factor-like protein [Planctomycetes bacterium]|nr:peptide chain release factor-like protein [Planctomycetota bacterium]